MKSLESQYNYLPENTQSRLVSAGVSPKTGIESMRISSERIPIQRIERSYIQNCDTLAGMFDGSIQESDHFFDGEARHGDVEVTHAIYLDKSARPVHLLMRKSWSKLSDAKIPHASYRNIDKHNWTQLMPLDTQNIDAPDVAAISLDNVNHLGDEAKASLLEQIARLRATYLRRADLEKLDEANLVEDVWKYPTILDGQRVAIVDEVKSSGATLKVADILLGAAIPEAKFEPMYWSVPATLRWNLYDIEGNITSREFMANTVPVWYDQISSYGRGIRDLDAVEASMSSSKKQRIGAYVMSRPYIGDEKMDKRSVDIREDLETLAARFLAGEVDYAPSPDRGMDDSKSRVERYYGIPYETWRQNQKRGQRAG